MSAFLEPDPSILENNLLIDNSTNYSTKSFEDSIILPGNSSSVRTPWKSVTPVPGCCIKTVDLSKNKVFINLCQLDEIPEPRDITESQLLEIWNSEEISDYRIPLSLQDPHNELDKSGKPAVVYDVAINTNFFKKIQKSLLFHSFVVQVVIEGIENKYNTELEKEKYIVLKNRKVLGILQPHRIKMNHTQPSKPLIEELPAIENHCKNLTKKVFENNEMPQIQFRLYENVHRQILVCQLCMPSFIQLSDICLNVSEDRFIVIWRDKDLLDLFIPVKVNQNLVKAFFFKEKQILYMYMPIIKHET